MKVLHRFSIFFDHMLNALAVLSAVIIIFLMLMICAEVFMRFFFNKPIAGVIEIAEYCLLFFTFLSATWLLKIERHAKIDAVFALLKPDMQSRVHFSTSVLCAICSLVLAIVGVRVVLEHFSMKLKLTTLLMPPSYLIIAIIPFGYILLFIQFCRRARRSGKNNSQKSAPSRKQG